MEMKNLLLMISMWEDAKFLNKNMRCGIQSEPSYPMQWKLFNLDGMDGMVILAEQGRQNDVPPCDMNWNIIGMDGIYVLGRRIKHISQTHHCLGRF